MKFILMLIRKEREIMKILRICLQGGENQLFDSKEDLRQSLIGLHWDDVENSYSQMWGFTKQEQKEKMKVFETVSLNELCDHFDWDYEEITDEQAKKLNND